MRILLRVIVRKLSPHSLTRPANGDLFYRIWSKETFLAKAKEKEAKDLERIGTFRISCTVSRWSKNFRRDRINLILRLSVATDSREFIGHATTNRSSNISYDIGNIFFKWFYPNEFKIDYTEPYWYCLMASAIEFYLFQFFMYLSCCLSYFFFTSFKCKFGWT